MCAPVFIMDAATVCHGVLWCIESVVLVTTHQCLPYFPSSKGVSHVSEPPVLSLWVWSRHVAEEPELLLNSRENRNSSGSAMHRLHGKGKRREDLPAALWVLVLACQTAWQLLLNGAGCDWSPKEWASRGCGIQGEV